MQTFTQEIVDLVTSNGGSMLYPALYDAVSPEKRSFLRNALKEAKSLGVLKQSVRLDEQTKALLHLIEKVS